MAQFKTDLKRKIEPFRKLKDKTAKSIFAFGGFFIIISIFLIIFFIGKEAVPLFKSYQVDSKKNFLTNKEIAGAIINFYPDEYNENLLFVNKNGQLNFYNLKEKKVRYSYSIILLEGEKIVSSNSYPANTNRILALGTSSGRILSFNLDYKLRYTSDLDRMVDLTITPSKSFKISENEIIKFDLIEDTESITAVALDSKEKIKFFYKEEIDEDDLFEKTQTSSAIKVYDLIVDLKDSPTDIGLYFDKSSVVVSTKNGDLYLWNVDDETVELLQKDSFSELNINEITMLSGRNSMVISDENGLNSVIFLINNKLQKIRELPRHEYPIRHAFRGNLKKIFTSVDTEGNVKISSTTSGKELLKFKINDFELINFAYKDIGLLALSGNNVEINEFDIEHPETSIKSTFSKVWYEGFEKPEYIWQSAGGTDDFEPKLSLIPLIFGTLKGTFYAVIFALPIAILAAICVSQFMAPKLKNTIKPVIEIMAALPSVVLGFLAGLWLAPRLDSVLVGVIIFPILLILTAFILPPIWEKIKDKTQIKTEGLQFFLISIPVILVIFYFGIVLGDFIENTVFLGSFTDWLYQSAGVNYDQRNALVIGIAMGFAVIPIIFTISEDALSNVPQHLVSGSLALGASRWQTALKVVLPSASPGIFSGVMIGIGRAIGETMIVLMATGNTAIMDWDIFNGFRTLAANIAVEIPEAPVGGSLYRMLFLSSIILFMFTFIINSIAETVRIRLRKKYKEL
ncbi:MAG: ABC transporter permease subunit [Deltaproteobacteria bacterium TMED126]|jgi:phosphate transport system permease protein|nr:ABC transporter permease subunit [Deltaproteobacteria bacterium TMED126]|tara:strand:- start:466 stop:2685 length:2220 start_codon:yes stop_codon:yes gene_type:complete